MKNFQIIINEIQDALNSISYIEQKLCKLDKSSLTSLEIKNLLTEVESIKYSLRVLHSHYSKEQNL